MVTAASRSPLPAELKPESVTIVVDTREQLPWEFPQFRTQPGTLDAGDYSVAGLESIVAIERKSLSDLIGCIGGERERFERELHRLAAYPARAVIVEASWSDLEAGEWRSQVTPVAVIGSVLGWISQGVPFVLAGNRERAELFAARMLFIAARRRYRECRELLRHIQEGGHDER